MAHPRIGAVVQMRVEDADFRSADVEASLEETGRRSGNGVRLLRRQARQRVVPLCDDWEPTQQCAELTRRL
jgi:hypothetical protein